jgi:type I restriction enzyme, S subunit
MSLTISPARIVEESGSPLLAARDSWRRRPLGEVASILNGFAFKSKDFVAKGGKPLIRIRDIFNQETAVGYVGDYDSRYIIRPGDLLVGMDGDFNSARWQGPEALLNQRVCKITPDPEHLDFDFLVHLLPGYLQAIHDLTSSTTVTHLSSRDIAQIPIPVPPLEEQRELARLLEVVSSKQESCGRHLAATRRTIERFRQAVLAAACSGSLTAEWRAVRGRESDGSNQPDGWTASTVESLAADVPRAIQSGPFGSNLKHSEFQTTGHLVIGIDNVLDGQFVLGRQHRISEAKFAELKKYEARPLDVLITVMATVGRVCVVPNDIESAIITKHVYRITVDQRRIIPVFLMHALRGDPQVREQIYMQTRGQTRPGINGQIVKGLVIAVPPVDEQREIIARVDALLSGADGLIIRINRATDHVERSSQSVLAKAFRGGLGSLSEVA